MKTGMRWTVTMIGCLVLWSGTSMAEDGKAEAPGTLEGQVSAVDLDQGKITIRANDGTIHEFQASRETLKDYKVGDPIKAKRRSGTGAQAQ